MAAPVRLIISMFSPTNIFTCLLLLHLYFMSWQGVNGCEDDRTWMKDNLASAKSTVPHQKIYVDQVGGHGNFATIQSAIDSVPKDNPNWVVIQIKKGSYRYVHNKGMHCSSFCNLLKRIIIIFRGSRM